MADLGKKFKKSELIDPIYEKFSKSVIRALGSTDFYDFFMDAISRAHNEFQFSNRKMEKLVDLSWVDAIEESLEGFQNIISNPRNIIREDEIIVNVANARKAGPDVVRHLAQHGALVENFDEETGDVRPSRLMQKIREDSTELYENRLVFTVLENAYHFVKIRHDALLDAMSEEYGAKLKVTSQMESATELVHVDMFLHIKEKDNALETDEKNAQVFDRIARIHRVLGSFMNSQFADQMKKINRVKGNITKTNVLKRNPDYKKIVKLWEFLHKYEDVGYMIKITEQNPYIDEKFTQDIYHNILFQYIILKGYLENEEDRVLPKASATRTRKLKPKMIKQIIEELTEDYDMPDVEIRKVLIEELTKEQLMYEEEQERLRLIEEAEQRKKEEEEIRRARERRFRREQEEEEERKRREKAREERLQMQHRLETELEERRRTALFMAEAVYFEKHKLERLELRREEDEKWIGLEPISDCADAALALEEAEHRKQEEMEQRLRIAREAKERKRREAEAAQIAQELAYLAVYLDEVKYFKESIADRKCQRKECEEAEIIALEQARIERQQQSQRNDKQSSKRRFGIR